MALVGLSGISVAHGGPPILDAVSMQIDEGERVGLLGRNASGKSTLMAVLAGDLVPDAGDRALRQGVTIARLPQEVPRDLSGRVGEFVASGVPEREEPWRARERVSRLLEDLRLDPDVDVSALSAGLSRRVLLARTLAASPDLLLLDEPTNHLDVPSIRRLEENLLARRGATVFVTHDRAFLRRVATRILEIDRGALTSWPGDYANYLRRKEERGLDEAHRREQADKKLAKEEVWRRKGVKAQRNRNQSRVEELERLRRERRERRDPTGSVRLAVAEAERSGRLVIEANGLVAGHGTTPVVSGLDLLVARGDRLGLVGPNGSGKTTLARTLVGDLPPLSGTVRRGANVKTAWFDPLNASLDPDKSVEESVADGANVIDVDGKPRHVYSYLADFLFEAGRARQPVRLLSGGERARLLLARLFARPSNLLVLDEPTNDLDAETSEVLEDALLAYAGTVLIISHDRAFLDEAVTNLLVFDGKGAVTEFVGGWSDWERQRAAQAPPPAQAIAPAPKRAPPPRPSGKDKRETEKLERAIAALEEEQRTIHAQMADPTFWNGPAEPVEAARVRAAEIERELLAAYDRWTRLSS
jgi:ABC transport system ATP-binding/permease protein